NPLCYNPAIVNCLRARVRSPFFILLAAFLVLGVYYSLTTPIFEAPDEPQHFFFVREIVERHGLPVQSDSAPGLWSQEGSQPPLYYLLGALATFWIDTDDWRLFGERNPYAVQGDPLALGNRNVFIHRGREAFPWQGTALAVHLLRWLSLCIGALSLVFTFQAARTLLPALPLVALAALLIGAAAYTNCRTELARRFVKYGMITGLVAFVVGGWWYVRNFLLYADVTGLNRMLAIVGQHQPPLAWWQVLGDSEGLR